MPRPGLDDYHPAAADYVALVSETEIVPVLEAQHQAFRDFLQTISEPDSLVRHAPYTWSTREVTGHIIDAERIFAYRLLRVARGDQTPLPPFEENAYMAPAAFDRIPLSELADEFDHVRRANLHLVRNLEPSAWSRAGVVSGAPVRVLGLAYVMAGHVRHHERILHKRFGRA